MSICAAAGIALAASASPALGADGYALNLSGPAAAVVGQPMAFQVSGSDAFDPAYPVAFSFSVGVIPATVVPACPANKWDGIQLANATGEVPVFTQPEAIDWNGNFSQIFGYTPSRPGTRLVCAYTVDLTGYTLATATLTVDVKAAASDPASSGTPPAGGPKPTNTKPPRVTRSGRRLVCDPGRWSNATGAYAYRWSVNGKQRKDAHRQTLPITRGLRAHTVTCNVTASNAAGATSAVSRALRVS